MLENLNNKTQQLPDISRETSTEFEGPIDRVGMSDIEMPISVSLANQQYKIPAKISAFVSLDQVKAKGIHMSRLYLGLKQIFDKQSLESSALKELLQNFVTGQEGLSKSSYVNIKFELPVERKALLSDEMGWRQYPIEISSSYKSNVFETTLGLKILYSSTCPCSAALARLAVSENFVESFKDNEEPTKKDIFLWLLSEKSITAVPHAQRSEALLKVKLKSDFDLNSVLNFIDKVEERLGTPVQSSVKRQDEQEFARLNAQNLMFCEDASRKIRGFLEPNNEVSDYYIRVEHIESLHPHSAVSVIVKGVTGGFTP